MLEIRCRLRIEVVVSGFETSRESANGKVFILFYEFNHKANVTIDIL